MPNAIDPILDAALLVIDAGFALLHARPHERAEKEGCLRERLAALTRLRDRLLDLGLPPTQDREMPERRAWEWDVKRALAELVEAAREYAEVAKAAPLPPEPDPLQQNPSR